MISPRLTGRTLLFLLAPGFNSAVYSALTHCLGIQGGRIINAGLDSGETIVSADHRLQVKSDISFSEAALAQPDYDAVLIIDQASARAVVGDEAALTIITRSWQAGRLVVLLEEAVAAVVPAGIVEGQVVAAPEHLWPELREAGAHLAQTPVAISGNLITATGEANLAVLCADIASWLAQRAPVA